MSTPVKQLSINPYVTGGVVGNSPAFVGRDDVLGEVLRVLVHPQNNAIVLYGQRRIGKTSVLRELEVRLLKQRDYIPIYFDLQDKAQQPLAQLLQGLARTIKDGLSKNKLNKGPLNLGSNPETAFHKILLPHVLNKLPRNKSLVLLFDEFDVLDAPDANKVGGGFFPYLRDHLLPLNPERLNFVFVIGRKIDDMTQIALSIFKVTNTKRVSLLNREDTVKLIRLSEANKTLDWSAEAIENIWQLTSGHPYLTQVLCSQVWHKLDDNVFNSLPKVTGEDIQENIINNAIAASESALEWLWDGLPPAERVVSSVLAGEGTKAITETQLESLLRDSGVQKITEKLITIAPRHLQEWDLIEPIEGGYRFRVELLRRWIAKHKPLNQVRDELARIEPEAEQLYETSKELYKDDQLAHALSTVRKALKINPNHVGANQLWADILLAQNQPTEALEILNKLFASQPSAARDRLIQVCLVLAQAADSSDEQKINYYERVLELDNNHVEANRQLLEISLAKGQIKQASDLLLKLYEIQPNETMDWVENEPRRKDAIMLLLLWKPANSEQNVQSVSGNGIVKKSLLEAMENKLSINQDLPTDIS